MPRRKDYETNGVANIMDRFKNEVAAELGVADYATVDKGALPARVHGKVGGNMVKKMVQLAESQLRAGQGEFSRELVANTGLVGFQEGSTGNTQATTAAYEAALQNGAMNQNQTGTTASQQ